MDFNTVAVIGGLGVVIFFFRDAIIALIGGSIRKASDQADKKDQSLAKQEDDLNDAANAAKQKADELGRQADNQPADEDWNKKR